MGSASYGYDYFCGANVYLSINGEPCLEVAGISYQMQDSTAPIYGYSSRIFDAVAIGQKIIKGNIVLNFVQPHYLAKLVTLTQKIDTMKSENVETRKELAQNLTGERTRILAEKEQVLRDREKLVEEINQDKLNLADMLEQLGADGENPQKLISLFEKQMREMDKYLEVIEKERKFQTRGGEDTRATEASNDYIMDPAKFYMLGLGHQIYTGPGGLRFAIEEVEGVKEIATTRDFDWTETVEQVPSSIFEEKPPELNTTLHYELMSVEKRREMFGYATLQEAERDREKRIEAYKWALQNMGGATFLNKGREFTTVEKMQLEKGTLHTDGLTAVGWMKPGNVEAYLKESPLFSVVGQNLGVGANGAIMYGDLDPNWRDRNMVYVTVNENMRNLEINSSMQDPYTFREDRLGSFYGTMNELNGYAQKKQYIAAYKALQDRKKIDDPTLMAMDAQEKEYNQQLQSVENMLADAKSGKAIESKKYDIDDPLKSLGDRTNSLRTAGRIEGLMNDFKEQVKKGQLDPRDMENMVSRIESDLASYYASKDSEAGDLSGPDAIVTDIGLLGPFSIDINFAKEYTIRILDAFFTSRGSMIQIDESAIVEEYTFFARDIIGVRQ